MIEKAIQRACERPVLSDTAMMKRIALEQKAAAEEIHETEAVASVGVMRTQRQLQGVDKQEASSMIENYADFKWKGVDSACQGKDRIVKILIDAGKATLSKDECNQLPTWEEVVDTYGDKPVIHGLETCGRFRELVSASSKEGHIRIAGLYNTGTNALSAALINNVKEWDGHKWEKYGVPWGKHQPAEFRWSQTDPEWEENSKFILPVISMKDPYRWMSSMCKAHYRTEWERVPGICPNLVNTGSNVTDPNNVRFLYVRHMGRVTDVSYDSLADMWSQWNQGYMDVDYPRLFIRFEDMLFHQEEVLKQITQCAGVSLQRSTYRYLLEKSKSHGRSSDFFSAIVKYGSKKGRHKCMTKPDMDYARTALDSKLMETFKYSQPPADFTPDMEDCSEYE